MTLPGLVIPPWVKLALRVAPWLIAAGLAAALLLTRARSEAALAKAGATIERLNGAVATQNVAVDAPNRQQVEASATREAAQRAAEGAAAGVRARLEAYKRPADGTPCPNAVGDALAREMWGRL